ncbi:hypothetical protein MMC10_011114 [Thelotrema lepadinum]|nr:hypothetical protein [Thelotrema lepadinum]
MRATSLSILFLPLISASHLDNLETDNARNSFSWPPAPPPSQVANASIPSPTIGADAVASHNFYKQQIPNHLAEFLLSFDSPPQDNEDLKKRQQGGVGGGGGVPPASIPTQMSPVTVYNDGSVAVTYTQLFSPTPVPWPGPSTNGAIGMGTLTGTYGVVKTQAADADALRGRQAGVAAVGVGAGVGAWLMV